MAWSRGCHHQTGDSFLGIALIHGDLIFAEGHLIVPGNGPGVIQNQGDVTFQGEASFEFQLLDASMDPLPNAAGAG